MFEGMFKRNKPKKQPTKQQLFDAYLSQTVNWKDQKQIPSILTGFADLIIWADKNSPSSIAQIHTHQILNIFSDIYQQNQQLSIGVLQCLTLIITNIKDEQFLKSIIENQCLFPTLFKQIPNDFQIVSYYVSFMKMLSQRINQGNVNSLVVEQGKCLLLQRCVQLYDTDDSLAQTAVLHIILNLMREKYQILIPFFRSKSFKSLYLKLGNNLIQLFKQMDKVVLMLNQSSMNRLNGMFEQLQDLLLFFTDLNKIQDDQVTKIVGVMLLNQIIYPIIVSSLRIHHSGVISINLAVFLSIKLLPLIQIYGISQQLFVSILAASQEHTFKVYPYNKQQSPEFKLQKLQNFILKSDKLQQNLITISTAQVRYTLFHLLTSKDDNLVYMVTHFLIKIFQNTRISKQTLVACGIYMRIDQINTNQTRRILIPLMIKQLSSTFRVDTLKNIANILIKLCIIKNSFMVTQEQKAIFFEIYQKAIDKSRHVLKNSEHYEYIVESFENDQKRICQRILESKVDIGYEAFLTPGEDYGGLPFFQRLPSNDKQSSRYDLVVFGLMRKIRYILVQQSKLIPEEISFQKFYQNSLTSMAGEYEPGGSYQIPKSMFLPCKLIAGKTSIESYIIEDSFHFIIGTQIEKKLKIIVNLRYKNINPIIDSKAGTIRVKVRGYSNKDQQWKDKQDLEIKADALMSQKIITNLIARRDLCRQSELSFISKLLSKSEGDIPKIKEEKPANQPQTIDLLGM